MSQIHETRLSEIHEAMSKLQQEEQQIYKELQEEAKAEIRARVDAWGLSEGTHIMMFAKQSGVYHWTISRTWEIKEIDFKSQTIRVVECSYSEADYEYFMRVESKLYHFKDLKSLEEQFNIYIVDALATALLHEYMCELKLDYENYSSYETALTKDATTSIKV